MNSPERNNLEPDYDSDFSAEPLLAGNCPPSGHPFKGGTGHLPGWFSTALDWGPASGGGSRK
jgi:hypothetical protein